MASAEFPSHFPEVRKKFADTRILVPYNPKAGIYKRNPLRAAHFRHDMHAMQSLLGSPEFFGFGVQFTPTKDIDHAKEVISEAISDGFGAIAPIGGDSTVNIAAHQIALSEHHKPTLIVPGGGTANILRGELTNRRDLFGATLDLMVNGEVRDVDLGIVKTPKGEYSFTNNAGLGADAILLDTWEREGKKNRLQLFTIFLRDRDKIQPYALQVDDTSDEGNPIHITHDSAAGMPIVNGGKYGKWFGVTNSDMTDGRMEGLILPIDVMRPENLGHLLTTATLPNRSFNGADYTSLQKATIRETNGEEIVFQCDGDAHRAGASEITVYVMKSAVPIMTAKRNTPTFGNWE